MHERGIFFFHIGFHWFIDYNTKKNTRKNAQIKVVDLWRKKRNCNYYVINRDD